MRRLLETDYTDANAIGGEFDYYPTPMWAVSVIIPHIAKRRNGSFVIIDPGAGIGNVSIVAAKSSLIVYSNFLNPPTLYLKSSENFCEYLIEPLILSEVSLWAISFNGL